MQGVRLISQRHTFHLRWRKLEIARWQRHRSVLRGGTGCDPRPNELRAIRAIQGCTNRAHIRGSLRRSLLLPYSKPLTPSEFKLVVEAAEYQRFPASYVVTNQDHSAKRLYLLLTGRARYFFVSETGQKVILLWIPPGEIFGPAALLVPPTGYHIGAETITNSSVLVWDRATIRSLTARYPRLIDYVLPLMLHYPTAYRAARIALLCGTAQERLARVLINLAHGIGREGRGGVELAIRNEELANEANITLFTTSRLLNQWQRAGLLVKS